MGNQCTGHPIKSNPVKYGKCAKCNGKTPWYCVGCKRWCCMKRRAIKCNKKALKLYTHDVCGKVVTFLKMCFHELHKDKWQQSKENDNDSMTHYHLCSHSPTQCNQQHQQQTQRRTTQIFYYHLTWNILFAMAATNNLFFLHIKQIFSSIYLPMNPVAFILHQFVLLQLLQ